MCLLYRYVEDVDIDPVIIINGLTKNWRCPGFRVCWIVAPKPIVDMLGSAGMCVNFNCRLRKFEH